MIELTNVLTLSCPLCGWSTRMQVDHTDPRATLQVAEYMADALLSHLQQHRILLRASESDELRAGMERVINRRRES